MSQQEISRREAHVDDDPKLLTPPVVVEPLHQCATVVQVIGGVAGALIEVEINGAVTGSEVVQSVLPYGITVGVAALKVNDKVRARQTTANAQSGWSSPQVTVRDHTQDFPAGPPRPEIFPLPLYKCGIRTGVGNLLVGGNVWMTADAVEVGRVNGCGNPQGINVSPAFAIAQKVRAWFEMCKDPSPPSIEHTTGTPPLPLPVPVIAQQYAGGNQLDISNIVNGAKVTVKRGGNVVGTWGCWGGSIRISGFAPDFSTSEVVEAFQEMCPGDPPSGGGTMTVQPCSSLPAPQVGPLQGGDTQVVITQSAPGATITVWVNGAPAGKGAAPVVTLNTTIQFGDTVIVAQDLPGCIGQRAVRITVPCVDPAVSGDPSAPNLFPVGIMDFDSGPNKGRIFYPADDDGTGQRFNERLAKLGRVPLVVMAHGNHDPRVPNYLGYDYFQNDLAKMGFVAVSVDCNAQNGMGYSTTTIVERRADLIIGAIAVLQQLDADPNSVLSGRIDFSRTGLMGHSQGGEAVVKVPEVITLPSVSIRGVIALAPTEGGATSRTPKGYPFMAILPASDGDVWPNDGAIYYDRAVPSPFKSQLFVHFTNHQFYNRQWLDDDSTWPRAAPTPAVLPRFDHERVLTAYGCAFFRAALMNHATTSYLAGKLLPAGVATQHVHLSFEQSDVLTVDNHEDGNGIAKNSLGLATQQLGGLSADEFPFHQGGGAFNSSFFGDSVGMIARAGGNGRIFEQDLGQPRDISRHEIWIRVAEVFERQDNRPPTGFQLGVRDQHGIEGWIDSDDVGGVPRPFPRNPATMKTMLKTFRFKSGCFAVNRKLDLKTVTTILLRCNRADERALAFDDLQIVAA